MNMKQFRYVLTLADCGTFSAAAGELGVSQPSLSQYIRNIENQIGLSLFERTNGYVRLTDAGRIYINYGRKILDLEHQMNTQFSDVAEGKIGSIIVGTSPYRSAGMMPEIAKVFNTYYPGIHLLVDEMVSSDLINKMEKGAFDLCLTILPVDERIFAYEKIMEEELVLAVPTTYRNFHTTVVPNRKYPAIDVTEIDGGRFVMLTDSQIMQKVLIDIGEEFHLSLKKAIVVKALEAQINMVRNGIGMAIVPTGIERFCGINEVSFYSFAQNLPRREVAAVWRKDSKQSRIVADLVSIMKKINW